MIDCGLTTACSGRASPPLMPSVRRREEKGFAWNRYLELAVYSSKRAIPRRSPPGIANTWACPSNQSRPTGLSRLPRLESRRFGLRSLRTPPTSVRARHRSWSIIASGTSARDGPHLGFCRLRTNRKKSAASLLSNPVGRSFVLKHHFRVSPLTSQTPL